MKGDRVIPRWRDERVLAAIAMKRAGVSWTQIAAAQDFSCRVAAQTACTNVRKADAKESGEDVSQCYW